MTFFNTGKIPSGASISETMPWQQIRALATDAELHDMYTYLHNLPVVEGPAK
jgi:hypothetical protein